MRGPEPILARTYVCTYVRHATSIDLVQMLSVVEACFVKGRNAITRGSLISLSAAFREAISRKAEPRKLYCRCCSRSLGEENRKPRSLERSLEMARLCEMKSKKQQAESVEERFLWQFLININ